MFMLNPKLLAEAFPINKVEVFFDAEDHSNFLGFQWEMVSQGKMPIGLNTSDADFNSIGKTGGEKAVTLTLNEVPPHYHYLNNNGNDDTRLTMNAAPTGGNNYNVYMDSASSTENGPYIVTNYSGGGQQHNNMPPYIVMAFWRRVA